MYGIPPKDAIFQEDAYTLAIKALMDTFDLWANLFDLNSNMNWNKLED